jgi:uncharacterized SAM-binding protein YcdF (DUF218 family)
MGIAGWFISITASLFLAAGVYAVPAGMCRLLNLGRRRFAAADATPGRTAVVLLSGRVEIRTHRGRTTAALAPTCAARVREAVRVHGLIAPEWIISAGRTRRPETRVPTCAELMRDELIRLGVPATRILVEIEARTTRDQAVTVAKMLRKLGVRHSVIVTSDVHMPRALGAFRAQGVSGTPAGAADPGASRAWPAWVFPTAHGFRFSGDVAHEVLGSALYRLRGWLS